MEVVGSEIGQKMRSAIKAKLTELGCYVDDELPDYVMVMVANKRTRTQMEDDLQLFLGDNTELFVNWLHQVLKKLQEVTVAAPLRGQPEVEKVKEKSKSKEKKSKDKKQKNKVKKTIGSKKAKKKDKEKSHKKEEKKSNKNKKKSKHHEMIRPNIPPLLMNMEKVSEPSITDVFAGQILKNHGVTIDPPKEDPKVVDEKPIIIETVRPVLPIIDPASMSSQIESSQSISENSQASESSQGPENSPAPESFQAPDSSQDLASSQGLQSSKDLDIIQALETNPTCETSVEAPRENQIKEINKIEAKIQGLKQKLAEQLDSMSDDEDFLNIRTEAEELMNDFAEDVLQEISQQTASTPPLQKPKSPPAKNSSLKPTEIPPEVSKDTVEVLPQIELKLPKRPIRERLGARNEMKVALEVKEHREKRTDSPERFTPERDPEFWPQSKSAKIRLGDLPEKHRKTSQSEVSHSEKTETSSKKMTSRVSVLENAPRASCAGVVRVRPRPRVAAPASSLLMRAVAEAHKSLLNIPPKIEAEQHKVKRALVLPMRRCVDAQKIVIQVPGGDSVPSGDCRSEESNVDAKSDEDIDTKSSHQKHKEDYKQLIPITKKILNSDYVPLRRTERTSVKRDDTLIVETINIHHQTVDKEKNTQFIVTMDGFNPNAFLAKKLLTEGLLDVEEETKDKPKEPTKSNEITLETKNDNHKEISNKKDTLAEILPESTHIEEITKSKPLEELPENVQSDTTEDASCKAISKETGGGKIQDKRRHLDVLCELPVKKRKASPIVFDVDKKDKEILRLQERQRLKEREREKVADQKEKLREQESEKSRPQESEKDADTDSKRERTESCGSDNHVIVTTTASKHKFDAVPPLSTSERKSVWCRAFPACRFGAACAYQHPRCKFAAACTRRSCPYSHALNASLTPTSPTLPVVASHVVPAANFKTITPSALPGMCKFYPGCANPTCHFFHPKLCRYGKACLNKLECNFYHSDVSIAKFRYPV